MTWILKGRCINLDVSRKSSCSLEDSAFKVSYSSAAVLCLGFASGAPCMFLGCVLSAPWMQPGCSLNEPWMGLGCVLGQP